MGISPAGATPASFMSYGIAKRMSKRATTSARARSRGVVAPETAAHAAGTAALLPMLSLGVPARRPRPAAVLLGGPADLGPQPGPLLFVAAEGLRLGPERQHVSRQPRRPLGGATLRAAVRGDPAHPLQHHRAVILVLCAIGAYTVHNNTFDVVMMMVFRRDRLRHEEVQLPDGAAGARHCARRTRPRRRSGSRCSASQGSLGVFFSNGLVGSIMTLGLIALFLAADLERLGAAAGAHAKATT